MLDKLVFKIADCEEEFEQIHRLNYDTFVKEIPQHAGNPSNKLIDKFHSKNTYCIVKDKKEVVGMISACDDRPFSVEQKLDNFDDFFPKSKIMLEVRLLSIKKKYRKGLVFKALIKTLYEHVIKGRYDFIVISGTLREVKLYRHIGFVSFGGLVGSKEAPYQPMFIEEKMMDVFRDRFFDETGSN